jgi:putative ABC transport system substrate-binding protein
VLLGGAAIAPVPAARAEQSGGNRRIAVLMNLSEADPAAQRLVATFRQELEQLGWKEGRNLHIDYRWSAGEVECIRRYAADLVALAPDAILA